MAEPARKYDPNIQPEIRPNLHVVGSEPEDTGASNTTAQDLSNKERKFGVYEGGRESTPERANLSLVPNSNIDEAKDKEASAGDWVNKVSPGGNKKEQTGIKGFFKKKWGPMAMVLTLLLGGGFGLSVIFSPGIALVQFGEAMVGDLNDQLGATSLRSDTLLRTKLKDLQATASVCTNAVSIRCKFATMSKRQAAKFKKAGFTIEPPDANKAFGRVKPTSITFPDNEDGTPGPTVKTPQELKNLLKSSPEARAHMQRAFNPKFAAVSDAISAWVFSHFKTDKSKKVNGNTDEERDNSVTAETGGEKTNLSPEGYQTDQDGRKYVIDENGNKVYESGDGSDPAKFKEISDKNAASIGDLGKLAADASPGSKAVSGLLKKGFNSVNILGYADTACTIYNTARAVAAAAKVARALQLAQYAMVFLNTKDRVKAGDATQEETTYLGNKLTAIDTNKTVVDEQSVWQGTSADNATAKEHDNPYYEANAFDSAGYQTAAYNDAPTLTSRDMQYMIGGGLSGTLSTVLDKISLIIGGRQNARKTCSVVQSWWARTAGLLAGVVSAVGSFGLSTAVLIGGQVAFGIAQPFLEAALADMAAGVVVSGLTQGVDTGDAMFAGSAALLGGLAMAHGMKPANKGELKNYLAATSEVKNEDIATETYLAKKTPFDINNQYSFLGSAVRAINPSVLKSTASLSGALTNVPAIISTAFTGLIPQTHAYETFNDARFSKCNDDGYAELGIDADVFCNVRYAMSPEQLAMDPDVAAQWMIDNGHTEEDGTPKSDDYKDWIQNCTQREDGWGETSNDDPGSDADKLTGKTCMQNTEENKYFGVFYMDKAINDSMDDDMSGDGQTGFLEPDSSGIAQNTVRLNPFVQYTIS